MDHSSRNLKDNSPDKNLKGSSSIKHVISSFLSPNASDHQLHCGVETTQAQMNTTKKVTSLNTCHYNDVNNSTSKYTCSDKSKLENGSKKNEFNERPIVRICNHDTESSESKHENLVLNCGNIQKCSTSNHYLPVPQNCSKFATECLAEQFLRNYLSDRGFILPKNIYNKRGISLSIASSGDIIFLPRVYLTNDEYTNQLNGFDNNGSDISREELGINMNIDTITRNNINNHNSELRIEQNESVSLSPQNFETDCNNVSFNIALILQLNNPTNLSLIKTQLSSKATIYWDNGLPSDRICNEEYYTIGELNWNLTNTNYNLYIPSDATEETQIIEKYQNIISTSLFQNNQDMKTNPYLKKNKVKADFIQNIPNDFHLFSPGTYVFILPIFFHDKIPETIHLPSGCVDYNLLFATKVLNIHQDIIDNGEYSNISNFVSNVENIERNIGNALLKKLKDTLHIPVLTTCDFEIKDDMIFGEYPIKVVRTPLLNPITTLDHPIYINRVWKDALSYEISFAQKYVPLDQEIPFKIKLVPLVKNLSVKLLRVNVAEKITYVSKCLRYEFDQLDSLINNPHSSYFLEFSQKRNKQRALSLFELRTKDKGEKSLREEIVTNSINDNILSYSKTKDDSSGEDVDIIGSFTLETKLKFPKFLIPDKKPKSIPPYGIDEFIPQINPDINSKSRRNSTTGNVMDFLSGRRNSSSISRKNSINIQSPTDTSDYYRNNNSSTSLETGTGIQIRSYHKLNRPKRGLYVDSANFRNMHVKHKLEITLRISKPDPVDGTNMKHYEVLIDTPLVLVSNLCNKGNLELPTYDITNRSSSSSLYHIPNQPPSFEQAISIPGSPITSPSLSPIEFPGTTTIRDEDDISLQHLSLSRIPTQTLDAPSQSSQSLLLNNTDMNHRSRRISNIDEMMQIVANYKSDYSITGSNDNAITSDEEYPPTYEEVVSLMSNE